MTRLSSSPRPFSGWLIGAVSPSAQAAPAPRQSFTSTATAHPRGCRRPRQARAGPVTDLTGAGFRHRRGRCSAEGRCLQPRVARRRHRRRRRLEVARRTVAVEADRRDEPAAPDAEPPDRRDDGAGVRSPVVGDAAAGTAGDARLRADDRRIERSRRRVRRPIPGSASSSRTRPTVAGAEGRRAGAPSGTSAQEQKAERNDELLQRRRELGARPRLPQALPPGRQRRARAGTRPRSASGKTSCSSFRPS